MTNPLRPNKQRSHYAILTIGLVLFLDIVSIFINWKEYQRWENPQGILEILATLDPNPSEGLRVFGIVYPIVNLASIIAFLFWFRRAYFNLHIIISDLRYKESDAVIWWLIPGFNWYKPFEIMKEMYVRSELFLQSRNPNFVKVLSIISIRIWWGFWIFSGIINLLIFQTTLKATEIEDLAESALLQVYASSFNILLALITIFIIKRYSEVESQLEETVQNH
jgi:hypothetical protein